jgi:SAM-dependent methyltransferase
MNDSQSPIQPPETCPVCGAAASFSKLCPVLLAASEPVYDLVECGGCNLRFLNPLPDTNALSCFYAPHYYGSDWYKQEEKGKMFARNVLRRGPVGRFLDVGCGLGYFIRAVADASGWEAHGVEISPEAADYAVSEFSLDVRCGELMDVGYPDQFFDFIRVNNVIEHVRDPLGFILECRRILRKGGRLYLSVPNGPVDSAGLINYFQEEKEPPRSKDGHLFFFSRNALDRLFQVSGLGIAAAHTYGIRRGLRLLGRYPGKPHWKNPYRLPGDVPERKEIVLPPRPRRLPGYAAYRYWQFRAKRLPGLVNFGLDFEILLTVR